MSTASTKFGPAMWDITTSEPDGIEQTITVQVVGPDEIHVDVDHDGLNADGKGSFTVTATEALHLSGVLATLSKEARS